VTQPLPGAGVEPRVAVVVVALVVVAVLFAVVGLRALGVGRHRPAVVLIGDSITANLESTARRQLGHEYALSVDGKPGFVADQQAPAVANAARFPFDQVVINLGTNDVMTSDHDLDETLAALTQIADSVSGIHCVHLVTVSEGMINSTNDAGPRARRLNAGIRAIAAGHPNVRVIDWATIERDYEHDHGETITTDTVHPNAEGNEVLADAYDASLATCAT
jgi:GDSL-like Lipase/Acylhydrolase family